MDSTIRSNLLVGMPLDLAAIRAGECRFAIRRRIDVDDEEVKEIKRVWSKALRSAFQRLPEIAIKPSSAGQE